MTATLRAIVISLVFASAAWQPMTASAALFNSHETRNTDFAVFQKWTGLLERSKQEQGQRALPVSGACIPNPRFACPEEEWRQLVAELKTLPLNEKLSRANRQLNRARYIIDPVNWGVPDYWATLKEFMAKHGDCEDYAIAKYVTLKAAGLPAESMRIVVVQDTNLGVPHAVLSVEAEDGLWILDNQVADVVPHEVLRHYRPIYSINETAWWLHSPQEAARNR